MLEVLEDAVRVPLLHSFIPGLIDKKLKDPNKQTKYSYVTYKLPCSFSLSSSSHCFIVVEFSLNGKGAARSSELVDVKDSRTSWTWTSSLLPVKLDVGF